MPDRPLAQSSSTRSGIPRPTAIWSSRSRLPFRVPITHGISLHRPHYHRHASASRSRRGSERWYCRSACRPSQEPMTTAKLNVGTIPFLPSLIRPSSRQRGHVNRWASATILRWRHRHPLPRAPASSNKRLQTSLPGTSTVALNDGPNANKENIPPLQDQLDHKAPPAETLGSLAVGAIT